MSCHLFLSFFLQPCSVDIPKDKLVMLSGLRIFSYPFKLDKSKLLQSLVPGLKKSIFTTIQVELDCGTGCNLVTRYVVWAEKPKRGLPMGQRLLEVNEVGRHNS